MEIYILRDGKQIGPFSEATVQSLLKQGNVLINDLAWSPGLNGWSPLHAVLYPSAQPPAAPSGVHPVPMPAPPASAPVSTPAAPAPEPAAPAPKVAESGEPATARQKAFLTFLGVAFSAETTKDRAAMLVNDAVEDPKNAGRLKRWEDERLRLHPDLFADEIKARRENRSQQYHEICQGEGAEFFEGVTKAHTQLLVGYLDVQFPNWDSNDQTAKHDYFFPALAEKFPQVVKKSAKGRFKLPQGPRVAAELVRSPKAVRARAKRSPVAAVLRGIVMGGIALAAIIGVIQFQKGGGLSAVKATIAKAQAEADAKAAKPTQSTPPATPIPTVAKAEPVETPEATPRPRKKPRPAKTDSESVPPSPPLFAQNPPSAPAPTLTDPDSPVRPGNDPAPTTPAPASTSLFDTTPPPPAPLPAPGSDTVAEIPGALTPTTPVPATPVPRVFAKVTKPTVVSLKFGTSTLRTGTPVQVLSAAGGKLTIKFGPDTVTIPAANTDYVEPAPAAAPQGL